jgi:hypothetical protein
VLTPAAEPVFLFLLLVLLLLLGNRHARRAAWTAWTVRSVRHNCFSRPACLCALCCCRSGWAFCLAKRPRAKQLCTRKPLPGAGGHHWLLLALTSLCA